MNAKTASKPAVTRLQLVLASVVTAAWIASLIVRVLNPSVATQFGVLDTVALLIFGFIFGVSAVRKNANGSEQ